jgi:hypothetical protein
VSLADPSGRAVQGGGLQPLTCWNCGFESLQKHGCLSFVSVVCCQVEVSASERSLVQRSPTECCVSEYDREASIMRGPTGAPALLRKKKCTSLSNSLGSGPRTTDVWLDIYDICLLTGTGLTSGGSSTVHMYTQTVHRTTQLNLWLEGFLGIEPRVVTLIGKSAGCVPSLRVISWHLPYNWGKSTEKPQSG